LSNTTLYWENNHASFGGAICVDDQAKNSCSTIEKGNVMYLERTYTLEKKRSVLPALCIIAGFHTEASCGIPSKLLATMTSKKQKDVSLSCATFLWITCLFQPCTMQLCVVKSTCMTISAIIMTMAYALLVLYNTLQSSSTENCICRCLLYNHKKLLQAQTWYLLSN